MTVSVWFVFTLVFWFVQGLSPRTNSLCFFGGQLVIDGLEQKTENLQCIFGNFKVPVSFQEGAIVCRYPALKETSYPVSITAGSKGYDLGVFDVESCVQVFYTPSCPRDKPNASVVLGNSIAASNRYMCVWNGIGREAKPEGLTITCPIPYHKDVSLWNLTLKTSDSRGYIGESPILLSFQYTDCQDQIPQIISLPPSTTPWSEEINLLISVPERATRTDNSVWCRYSTSGLNSLVKGTQLSDGSVTCPPPILPAGRSTLEISTDGVTFSQPVPIWIESGIYDFFPKHACTQSSNLQLSVKSKVKFLSNISYECYFGSVRSTAEIADDYTLVCSIPYGAGSVELSLLVHNRSVNKAAGFVVGTFFHDESC